uniref:Uncharacterized protein n=1 Tax=Tanacetum cinerariifolium TaxID=118510 RepID=A0A6L2KPN1_TANCI|nr:hypothetical protein [Tanacetum cinerariifolium]
MSSSDSTVTYTSISFEDVLFWGIRFFGMEHPDSPEAAPQSPIQTLLVPYNEDERGPMFIQPHDPDYVLTPMYPKYIPLEDEHVLSAEEKPLPPIISPTVESPEYVAESDPEEDPEENEDDETEDGPVGYPMDRGDDGDDNNGKSSGDDADDEDEDKEGEEEEEHFVLANSTIVIPTDELAAISLPPEAKVKRLLAMPTPPPSPLASLSPPSARERLARLAFTQALFIAVTAVIPSPPLPPPLYIPPHVDRRDDIPKIEMPPLKSTLDAEARRRGIRQDSRTRISQRVDMDSQWVDLLMEDRIAHQETILIVEEEAYDVQEAMAHSIRLSQAVYYELQTYQEQVRQAQMVKTLRVMRDMRQEMRDMQAKLLALREQPRRARQPGGDARVLDHQDAPRDADSHI